MRRARRGRRRGARETPARRRGLRHARVVAKRGSERRDASRPRAATREGVARRRRGAAPGAERATTSIDAPNDASDGRERRVEEPPEDDDARTVPFERERRASTRFERVDEAREVPGREGKRKSDSSGMTRTTDGTRGVADASREGWTTRARGASGRRRTVGERWALDDATLGRGSFATVWRATCVKTGAVVAVKEIACERLSKKLRESLKLEVEVMRRMRDENILRFIDMQSSNETVYIVLEYCGGGDLSQFIKRHGRMEEIAARRFMLQLARGLKAMRKAQIVHRDLKPQNLLLTSNDLNAELKIADFGFARYIRDSEGMADTVCGSPLYMAPEVLNYQRYDAKADLWSVGAILFEMLVGTVPFTGQNQVQLLRNIQKTEFKIPIHIAQGLSAECIDLLRGLLHRDAANRISFEEFFNHPFLKAADVGVGIPTKPGAQNSQGRISRSGCSDDSETMPFDMDVESASPSPTSMRLAEQAQRPISRPVPTSTKVQESGDKMNIGGDYVLVSSPGASGPKSTAMRSPSLGSSPLSRMSLSPRDGAGATFGGRARMSRGTSPSSQPMTLAARAQTQSQILVAQLGVRVGVLEKAAAVLRDSSMEHWNAGSKLEALSLGLISLAALRTAHRFASEILTTEQKSSSIALSGTSASTSSADSSPTAGSSMAVSAKRATVRIGEAFQAAHTRAEKAAAACNAAGFDMNSALPDGMELVYQQICKLAKEGVREELAENKQTASDTYGRAQTLLQFLIGEGPGLHITPPLVIDGSTHARLSQLSATLASRQNALDRGQRA